MKREMIGLVLCGGRGRRIGVDKANLRIREGVTQLEYMLSLLEPCCSRLAIGLGPKERRDRALRVPEGVERLYDDSAVRGPMGGLLSALDTARGLPVLMVACDMAYVEQRHVVQLLNRRNADKLATAFVATDGMPDPMFALYEQSCLGELRARGQQGKTSLRGCLIDCDVELVEADNSQFLLSVNTADDLREARERLGGR